MKAKYFVLTLILFSTLSFEPQDVFSQVSREWIATYNTSTDDGKAIVVDISGNVYVTGKSGTDYATVKYNSSGVQLWVSRYTGTGAPNAIAVDDSGNVYVTGSMLGTPSNVNILTVKYNTYGVQQWTAVYDFPANSFDVGYAIAVDGTGNVFVTGNSYSNTSNYDYVTIKYNSSGSALWSRRYNGLGNNSDNAFKLVIDNSGNVYVTGWSRGTGNFDDDYLTIKYNSSGDSVWVKRYGGLDLGYDQASSIALDSSGNVYVTGKSQGTGSSYDYATIKYNSSGDSLWVKRFNGIDNSLDAANSIAVDTSGNVFVSGSSYNNASNYDFVTIKYNSSGSLQWSRNFNGPGNSVDNQFSMALDKSGNVYVTGSSNFTGQSYNYATVKYNSAGSFQWSDIYNGTASGSDESFSIAADTSGNVYITGSSAGLGQSKDFVTIKYSQKPYAAITLFIEGLYNSSTDKLIGDTLRLYLRNTTSPFSISDSSKAKIDSAGNVKFYFPTVINAVNFYLVIKLRNSIETWSNFGYYFSAGVLNYNFSNTAAKAYGANQVQVDSLPIRFAIYSGDENQDGFINLTDVVNINNDANIFLTGYGESDINGDNIVNLTDVLIAYNNSTKFVSVIRP